MICFSLVLLVKLGCDCGRVLCMRALFVLLVPAQLLKPYCSRVLCVGNLNFPSFVQHLHPCYYIAVTCTVHEQIFI